MNSGYIHDFRLTGAGNDWLVSVQWQRRQDGQIGFANILLVCDDGVTSYCVTSANGTTLVCKTGDAKKAYDFFQSSVLDDFMTNTVPAMARRGDNGFESWRPMETAPKDGTHILCYGKYSDTPDCPPFRCVCRSLPSCWEICADYEFRDFTPLGWQPLPPLPKEARP